VNVPYRDIRVTISVRGGAAYITYFKDNVEIDHGSFPDGWSVSLIATKYVCVNSPASEHVYFTFNGSSYGPVSSYGGRRVYIDITGPRYASACPPTS
jgi:hypothetical protein